MNFWYVELNMDRTVHIFWYVELYMDRTIHTLWYGDLYVPYGPYTVLDMGNIWIVGSISCLGIWVVYEPRDPGWGSGGRSPLVSKKANTYVFAPTPSATK